MMLPTDMALKSDPVFRPIAAECVCAHLDTHTDALTHTRAPTQVLPYTTPEKVKNTEVLHVFAHKPHM